MAGVHIRVAVACRLFECHGMLGGPALHDPLTKRRAAACRELLNGERSELASALHLSVESLRVALQRE
jgi:hypothetical protein